MRRARQTSYPVIDHDMHDAVRQTELCAWVTRSCYRPRASATFQNFGQRSRVRKRRGGQGKARV
jgi:hypothetical protein